MKYTYGQTVMINNGCGTTRSSAHTKRYVSCQDCGGFCKFGRIKGKIVGLHHKNVMDTCVYSIKTKYGQFPIREDYLEPDRISKMILTYDCEEACSNQEH